MLNDFFSLNFEEIQETDGGEARVCITTVSGGGLMGFYDEIKARIFKNGFFSVNLRGLSLTNEIPGLLQPVIIEYLRMDDETLNLSGAFPTSLDCFFCVNN